MESKIFLIFLDNMDAGCQFVGYVRSEEAAEKVCDELNATTPWDFGLPVIDISNWTAWNMDDEGVGKLRYS